MNELKTCWIVTLALAVSALGCGARSGLSTFETSSAGAETSGAGGVGTGGQVGAGAPAQAGKNSAGMATGGAAPVAPPESYHLAAEEVGITEIATGKDGRVAIAGYFRGALVIDGALQPELVGRDRSGFVLMLDATGQVEWVKGFTGSGTRTVTGVGFGSNELIVQGSWVVDFNEQPAGGDAFTAGLDQHGDVLWQWFFGGHQTQPGRLSVSDSQAFLTGNFIDDFASDAGDLHEQGRAGYLLKLRPGGVAVWARKPARGDWSYREVRQIAAKNQNQLFVLCAGDADDGRPRAALLELDESGMPHEAWPTKEFSGPNVLAANALAFGADSLISAGAFAGRWPVENEILQTIASDANDASTDAWLLRYSPFGEKQSLRAYSSQGAGNSAAVSSIAANDQSFFALVTGQSLLVEGKELVPQAPYPDAVFVVAFDYEGATRPLRALSGYQLLAQASALDAQQNLWIGGQFARQVVLGGRLDELEASGEKDAFVLRIPAEAQQ